MEFTRISVPITVDEREALRTLAHSMKRDPRQLARAILRNALGITEGEQEWTNPLAETLPEPPGNVAMYPMRADGGYATVPIAKLRDAQVKAKAFYEALMALG